MEEDIKILEEFIDAVGEEYEVVKEKQALENLIKRYGELEKHIAFYEKHGSYKKRIIELKEENEELKEQVEYLKHEVVLHGSTVEKLVREKMNSIPKSKVEEQIQWLDNDIKNTKEKIKREQIYWDDIRKIRLKAYNTKSNEIRNRLQELLEEE